MFKGLWTFLIITFFAWSAWGAERTLTVRIPDEPETLDWNRAHTTVETYLLMNLMEGLVSFDSNLKVIPRLAKSWTISADGKTYTFKLRPGVAWSDGTPLKADDFVYSWRRLLSPVTASGEASILFDVVNAEAFHKGKVTDPAQVGIKALNLLTLQVELTHPVAQWIYTPTFWVTFPLRQDVVEKNGTGWASPGRIVTLGPYRMESHDMNENYVLRPNPHYYGTRGNIEKLVFLITKDDSEAMKLYESGKIDFLSDISAADINRLRGRSDLRSFPYLTTAFLGFSTTNFPADDVNIRRAIAMAIDRSELSKLIYQGRPATSFVSPPLLGYDKKAGLPFDPAKAKLEFRKSGLDPYRKHEIALMFPDWDRERTVAEFVKTQLEKYLPLKVKLTSLENRTYRLQLELHGSPVFLGHWGADFPDANDFFSLFVSKNGKNRFDWTHPDLDRDVAEARGLLDARKRQALYTKAQALLLEEKAVVLPLYYEPKVALVKSRVHGLTINPLNHLLLGETSVDH